MNVFLLSLMSVKLKLVGYVMEMVYILAKFYLLGLSVIEKVCWNFSCLGIDDSFLQGCPLSFYTFEPERVYLFDFQCPLHF